MFIQLIYVLFIFLLFQISVIYKENFKYMLIFLNGPNLFVRTFQKITEKSEEKKKYITCIPLPSRLGHKIQPSNRAAADQSRQCTLVATSDA